MIGLTIQSYGFGENIARLKKMSPTVKAALLEGIQRGAYHLEGAVRETVRDTFPRARTGALMRSYHAYSKLSKAGVFSRLIYAGIQDKGGTIKPRNKKYLAVPLIKMPVGKWPRHWPRHRKGTSVQTGETVCFKNPSSGKLLIWRVGAKKKGGGRKVTAIYALKQSVEITGRDYLKTAFLRARDDVIKIVSSFVHAAIGKL